MKSKIAGFIIIFVVAMTAFGAGTIFGAGSAEPGTQGDPLISLSYLEERLAQLEGDSAAYCFKKLSLSRGDKLWLDEGSELIVYSGNATVTGNGLISLTGGEMFSQGTSTVLYNLFLAPENGSGITASGELTVYIKGVYRLTESE